jgi:uncharacterized membrane protein
MTAGNAFAPDHSAGEDKALGIEDPELFSAVLTPHRSLNRTGFLVLMAVVSAVSFIAGMVFLIMGAWPVFGFFGLDVLVIYLAFRINYRRARAYEEVSVTSSELRYRRVNQHGRSMEWTFNPQWVKLDQEIHAEFGVERLYLASRGQRIGIGSFLGPDEKASFAKALTEALHDIRRGPTYNPIH